MPGSSHPIRKRRRPAHSCVECRRRKVRCDRNQPCAQCLAHEVAICTYTDHRKAVAQGSPTARTIDHRRESPQTTPDRPRSTHTQTCTPASTAPILGTWSKTRLFGRGHWMNTVNMAATGIPNLGTTPEHQKAMSQQANETPSDYASQMMAQCKQLAREAKKQRPCRRSLPPEILQTFPERRVMDQLIQLYFHTFESCYRILHFPSFRAEYGEYVDQLEKASSSFLVELLLLMSIAGTCHENAAVREELATKTQTWIHVSQTWLSAPLEKDRLTVKGLQIHCLLLLSRQVNRIGADLVWIAAGSLMRMAMQMGLHQDPDCLDDTTLYQKEMRRRIWYTVLEMNVQSALDSGMTPMISENDYNTQPPSALDDHDLASGHDEEPDPADRPSTGQLSVQPLLASSIPIRIRATRVINSLQGEPEYEDILRLGNEMSKDFQSAKNTLEQLFSNDRPHLAGRFTYSFCAHLLDRFLLCLHFPYAVQAAQNPLYFFSHKESLDVALEMISFLDDEIYGRVLIRGGGMFRDIITRGALMVLLELNANTPSGIPTLTNDRNRARQAPLLEDIRRVAQYARDRMTHGETNVKGFVCLSVYAARMVALFEGSSTQEAMATAVHESFNTCRGILEGLVEAAADGAPSTEVDNWMYNTTKSPHDVPDVDLEFWDDVNLDFDFARSDVFQAWVDQTSF